MEAQASWLSVGWAWVIAAIASILSLLALLGVLAAMQSNDTKADWLTAVGEDKHPPTACDLANNRGDQCEAVSESGVMVETWNTLSNLGYLFAGWLIVFRARNASGYSAGISIIVVGLFSAWYHARLTHTAQIVDVGAIYGVFGALTLMAMEAQPGSVRSRTFQRTTAGGVSEVTTSTYPLAPSFDWLIALGVVVGLIALFNEKWFASISILSVVLVFWLLPRLEAFRKLLGGADDFIQPPLFPRAIVWIVTPLLCAFVGYLLKEPLQLDSTMIFVVLAVVLLGQLIDLGVYHKDLRSQDRSRLAWLFVGLIVIASGAFALRLTDGSHCSVGDCAEVSGQCALDPDKQAPPPESPGSCRRPNADEIKSGADPKSCQYEGAPFVHPKPMCHPDWIFQAHAGWHFLGAFALLFTYEIVTYYQARLASSGFDRNRTVFWEAP